MKPPVHSSKIKNDQDATIADKRWLVNIIVVIYSVYISVLWSLFLGKSIILKGEKWTNMIEGAKKLGFPNLDIFREFYFWTSFIAIVTFAYAFSSLILLSTPSRILMERPFKLNIRRWRYFFYNFGVLVWLFLLPCLFLEIEYVKISLVTFLSSLTIIIFSATGVIDYLYFFKRY